MSADEILRRLRPTGSYQKRLILIVLLFAFANAWAPLSVIFTHYEPKHYCKTNFRPYTTSDDKQENFCNDTLPWEVDEDGKRRYSSCLMYKETNFVNNSEECPKYESNETTPCSEWIFETKNDGGETVVSEMGLVCDKEWIMPFIVSIMMVGRAIGLMISGAISDWFGRRPVLLSSSFLLFCTAVGMAFSRNIYVYGTFLLLSGAFSIIQYAIICVIGTEMVVPRYRNFVVLTIQFGYVLGYATLPLMAYISNDWHVLLYIISVGSLVFVLGYWYFPETIQWLICKGEIDKAKILVHEIAKYNNVQFAEEELNNLIQQNDEIKESKEDIGEMKYDSRLLTLLKNSVMRCRLLVSTFVWFITSFVYYAITLNTSYLQGDRYINCLLAALLEIPSIALAYWMLNKVGRVKTSIVFFFGSAIACIAAPLLEQTSHIAISVMAIAGKTAISGAFYVIYIHTVEIAPTLNRNLFMNICSAFSNIGSILSPYAMLMGKSIGSELAIYVVMGVLSAIGGALIFLFLPETVGRPLPATIQEAVEQKTLVQSSSCRCAKKKKHLSTKEQEIEKVMDL